MKKNIPWFADKLEHTTTKNVRSSAIVNEPSSVLGKRNMKSELGEEQA